MPRIVHLAALGAATAGLLVNLGCTMSANSGLATATHFVYPNSNVTAGNTVTGEYGRFCGVLTFGTPPGQDDMDRALADALASSGADLLLNARYSAQLKTFVLFSQCKTTVTGTAATVEVGQQQLTAE